MVKSGRTRPKGKVVGDKKNGDGHWSQLLKKVSVRAGDKFGECVKFLGGSDNGQLIYLGQVSTQIEYESDCKFGNGDVVLKIQQQPVSGYTLVDAVNLLQHCCKNFAVVSFECVSAGEYLTISLIIADKKNSTTQLFDHFEKFLKFLIRYNANWNFKICKYERNG